MTITRIAPIALVAALVTAACGGGTSGGAETTEPPSTTGSEVTDTTTTETTPPGAGSEVVLTITDDGGFVPLEYAATNGPRFVLTADGTLYAQGPVPAVFPGPLVTPYVVADASGSMEDIQRLIDAMGLADITNEQNTDASTMVADASTTTVTYYDDSGGHMFSVYALGFDNGLQEGDQVIDDERADALYDLTVVLQDVAASSDTTPYEPATWQVMLSPAEDPTIDTEPQPWPLAVTPDDFIDIGGFFPCVVIDSDPTVDAAFNAASVQTTTWDHEGTEWYLLVRALLPGEKGCEAVA